MEAMSDQPPTIIDVFLGAENQEEAIAHLKDHEYELLSEDAEAEIVRRHQTESDPLRRQRVEDRLELVRMLRPVREHLLAVREHLAQIPEEQSHQLGRVHLALYGWLRAPSWEDSEAYLRDNAGVLLGDEADEAFELIARVLPDNAQLHLHRSLLENCRKLGIARAYAELKAFAELARNKVALPVIGFVCAESDEEVEQVLIEHGELLATEEARLFLEDLLALAEERQDARMRARAEERLVMLTGQ